MRRPLMTLVCSALMACSGEQTNVEADNPTNVSVPSRPTATAVAPPAPPQKPAASTAAARDPRLVASVRSMAKIKRAFSPSFSPDGKRIAFVSDRNGIPSLYVVPSEGGAPVQVATPKDQVRSVAWWPDG